VPDPPNSQNETRMPFTKNSQRERVSLGNARERRHIFAAGQCDIALAQQYLVLARRQGDGARSADHQGKVVIVVSDLGTGPRNARRGKSPG
jgi:hypothetical protein